MRKQNIAATGSAVRKFSVPQPTLWHVNESMEKVRSPRPMLITHNIERRDTKKAAATATGLANAGPDCDHGWGRRGVLHCNVPRSRKYRRVWRRGGERGSLRAFPRPRQKRTRFDCSRGAQVRLRWLWRTEYVLHTDTQPSTSFPMSSTQHLPNAHARCLRVSGGCL